MENALHLESQSQWAGGALAGWQQPTSALWPASTTVLVGPSGNSLLWVHPSPRTGAPVMLRCHHDTSVAHSDCCVCAGMQISRPGSTHDPCRCLLTPNPRETTTNPLFVSACARQGTTGGEQLRLRGQVGLGNRQTCLDRLVGLFGGLVGVARVTGGCAEATDTL